MKWIELNGFPIEIIICTIVIDMWLNNKHRPSNESNRHLKNCIKLLIWSGVSKKTNDMYLESICVLSIRTHQKLPVLSFDFNNLVERSFLTFGKKESAREKIKYLRKNMHSLQYKWETETAAKDGKKMLEILLIHYAIWST